MDSWRILAVILKWSGWLTFGLCQAAGIAALRIVGGTASTCYGILLGTAQGAPEVAGAAGGLIGTLVECTKAIIGTVFGLLWWLFIALPWNLFVLAFEASGWISILLFYVLMFAAMFGLISV